MPIEGQHSASLLHRITQDRNRSPGETNSGGAGTRDESAAPRIHLIGAGGTGMTALSQLLADCGCDLTGSDLNAVEADSESAGSRRAVHLDSFETTRSADGSEDVSNSAPAVPPPAPAGTSAGAKDNRVPGRVLRLHRGHDSSNVPHDADLAIYSPAVGSDNPERVAARGRGIPEVSYVEMLGELASVHRGICIAGTHGKTTTTAMTASILKEAGLPVSAIVGGEVIQYSRSGWASPTEASPPAETEASSSAEKEASPASESAASAESVPPASATGGELSSPQPPFFVVEACEYRRHFLHFHPNTAAILNIEPDHFDCFGSLEETYRAFEEFADQIEDDGALIIRADSALLPRMRKATRSAIETFQPVAGRSAVGRTAAARLDWAVSSVRQEPHRTVFDVLRQGRTFGTIELSLPGRHNIENALVALALAHAAGVPAEAACDALSRFKGVRRRFEEVLTWNGITLVDDYAHHPTAVQATLEAARVRYPGRRLVAVFQPHQISRTRALMNEFAGAFEQADRVLLTPIFAARENPETADAVLAELADHLGGNGGDVGVLTSLDRLQTTLEDSAEPGDVWLTLGAGNIDRIPHEFA